MCVHRNLNHAAHSFLQTILPPHPRSPHCLLEWAPFRWLQGKRVKSGQGEAGALAHSWFPPLSSEHLLASLVPQGPSAATVTGVLGLEDVLRPSTSMKNQGTSTGSAGGTREGSTSAYEKRLSRPGNSPLSGSPPALQSCDSTGHPPRADLSGRRRRSAPLVV